MHSLSLTQRAASMQPAAQPHEGASKAMTGLIAHRSN